MRCPGCSRENREGASFCDGCGVGLARTCARCGADLRPEARFCDSCGERVITPATDVRSRTPEHLVEKILEERTGIEGERRNVTVMFVDAKGFTPLSEQLDAEQIYTFTQGCTERMLAAVHRHEGTVTQFTGDGIVALFGAPIAHEDAARRAVSAALDMQDALSAYVQDAGLNTAFRIGLNTGPVVVGRVGDDLSMDYTAVGDTVNLAARMEQIADPGAVFMTAHTFHDVSDYFECIDLGLREVKGKSEPIHVYRPVSATGARTRIDAAVARGLSPFVGRDRDINVLKGLWQEALAGRGQIVMISGEPGIGKSRLLLEFKRALGDDVVWREAHCVSYGESIPYLPVIELVKNGFGITDADDDGTIITKVDTDVALWSPEAQKMAPYLKFLLSVDPGDARIESIDPVERRAGILDALRALVLERSKVAPRVVVVEDLHWADDQSEEAFRVCADAVAASRVLMILTFRPGYMHPSADMPNSHRIALTNLDESARSELASATLEASALPSDLAAAITTKAEGNPLFIEEVTKAIAAGITDVDSVPNSLQDVILSRIDRLETSARESLQLASVIGREFTLRLLNRISDLSTALEGVLTELKMLELIYEKSFFPELAYMFKHALTHDVAYSTLLLERRKALHRVVAIAIEELYEDRLAEHYETLAHHYSLAEEREKALLYLERAGDKAMSSFATSEGIAFYTRALDIAQTLDLRRTAHGIGLLTRRGFAYQGVGDLEGAITDWDEAVSIAREIDDRRLLIENLINRGCWGEFFAHQYETAIETLREALALTTEDDLDLRFAALTSISSAMTNFGFLDDAKGPLAEARALIDHGTEMHLGWHLMYEGATRNWSGDYRGAADALTDYRKLDPPGKVVELFVEWFDGVRMGGDGSYQEGLAHLAAVIEDARRVGDPYCVTRALNTIGWIHNELQDFEAGARWNLACLEEAAGANYPDPEIEANAKLNLADAYIAMGRLDDADAELSWVERIVRGPQPEERWALWIYSQHLFHTFGELCLIRGDVERAQGYAEECLAIATQTGRRKNIVKATRLLGEIAAARGELDLAEAKLDDAIEIANEVANPCQLWKTWAALGEVRAARGNETGANDAYRRSAAVVDGIASALTDETLRETFRGSARISEIVQKAR